MPTCIDCLKPMGRLSAAQLAEHAYILEQAASLFGLHAKDMATWGQAFFAGLMARGAARFAFYALVAEEMACSDKSHLEAAEAVTGLSRYDPVFRRR